MIDFGNHRLRLESLSGLPNSKITEHQVPQRKKRSYRILFLQKKNNRKKGASIEKTTASLPEQNKKIFDSPEASASFPNSMMMITEIEGIKIDVEGRSHLEPRPMPHVSRIFYFFFGLYESPSFCFADFLNKNILPAFGPS